MVSINNVFMVICDQYPSCRQQVLLYHSFYQALDVFVTFHVGGIFVTLGDAESWVLSLETFHPGDSFVRTTSRGISGAAGSWLLSCRFPW